MSLVSLDKSLRPDFLICKMVAHSGSFLFLFNSCGCQDEIG